MEKSLSGMEESLLGMEASLSLSEMKGSLWNLSLGIPQCLKSARVSTSGQKNSRLAAPPKLRVSNGESQIESPNWPHDHIHTHTKRASTI